MFVFIFLLINVPLFSNDTFFMTSGASTTLADIKPTNVSMAEEEINITLYRSYYEVDVTMSFYNDGSTENLLLGFPVKVITSGYDVDKYDLVYDFKSYINGVLITDFTVKEEEGTHPDISYWSTHTKWFLREVSFPEKSHTYSRVTYKARYNSGGFGSEWASYIYGTGSVWKGPIGKMTVFVNHDDDTYVYGHPRRQLGPSAEISLDFSWESNGRYKYVARNVEPKSLDDEFGISVGSSLPFDDNRSFSREELSDSLIFRYFEEIKLYTKNQIRLFVNYFYALHGYDFKNIYYKRYFENYMNNTGGFENHPYKVNQVNPNFSESDFTYCEKRNIEYLVNLEKKIPN